MLHHPVAVDRDVLVEQVRQEEVPPARVIGQEEDAPRLLIQGGAESIQPLGPDAKESAA
jgi:hypothetical protein